MLDIIFGSQIGIMSLITMVFIFVMLGYLGWKFNKLSKQPREPFNPDE